LAIVPGKNVTVSALPPLDEFFAPPTKRQTGGPTILFFGTVRKYKGLNVLLAAMPKVLLKVKCSLIIVGEFYDSIDKYERLIREHHIESQVHLDNRYVPNEEVPGIFQQADVLVLPYLSATQSGVARIAISNGLPVIASRTGGLSEAVIEGVNGLLFPPGDSDALADRLVMYFNDKLNTTLAKNNLASSAVGSECRIIETIEKTARTSLPEGI
jgi:glycosyltransferase involved in cell wall biosynthesis